MVKPAQELISGDQIQNMAEIYFDYNYPIITNLAVTEISALSVPKDEKLDFTFYPNPAQNKFRIISDLEIESAFIFNSLGQLMLTDNSETIDVSDLPVGSYFVRLTTSRGSATKVLLKK